MALHQVGDMHYHVDNYLMKFWLKNSLDLMQRKNMDRVYLVDGKERIGKSLWTIQQAAIVDPKMFTTPEEFVSRVCFTAEEFFDCVRKIKNGAIIFDEAFRGFASRSAMSKVNKKLVQALMEMGQNNNIVFIVLPSFFMLDIYPAMLRSNTLFRIFMDRKSRTRCWGAYNNSDKNKIYQMGIRKGWNYAFGAKIHGKFYDKFPGGDAFKAAYLKKKAEALATMDKEGTGDGKGEENLPERMKIWIKERDLFINLLFILLKQTYPEKKVNKKRLGEWISQNYMKERAANTYELLIKPENYELVKYS